MSLLTPIAHDLGATEGMAGQAMLAARALLGVTIGGFWALSTATVIQLVPEERIPKAMGILYTGNAVATAFAAPIGSYLGGVIGWRGVFWALVPLGLATLAWQWASLPSMPRQAAIPLRRVLGLLKRRNVLFAMFGLMLTFGGVEFRRARVLVQLAGARHP